MFTRLSLKGLQFFAAIVSAFALTACWTSETLLFPEEAFIDPFGGEFKHNITARKDAESGQAYDIRPSYGRWFFAFPASDPEAGSLIAFVRGDYATPSTTYKYLTIIEKKTDPNRYEYSIGKLRSDGRELEKCFLDTLVPVGDRVELEFAMRAAVQSEREGREASLTCVKFTSISLTPRETRPSSNTLPDAVSSKNTYAQCKAAVEERVVWCYAQSVAGSCGASGCSYKWLCRNAKAHKNSRDCLPGWGTRPTGGSAKYVCDPERSRARFETMERLVANSCPNSR